MSGEIEFAHIVFRDDTARFHTVPISDVKYKKNSRNHIAPTNGDDFNKRQVYYAAWRDCGEQCEEDHSHIGYYPAFILLLGGKQNFVLIYLPCLDPLQVYSVHLYTCVLTLAHISDNSNVITENWEASAIAINLR